MPKTTTTVETNSKSPQIPPAITYRLSEPYYFFLGWTVPPLRNQHESEVVTVKAKFSHSVICPWFKERSENVEGKYSNGQILYRAMKNGTGSIHYPNGNVAIKIEKTGAEMSKTQVWVYHSGDVERDGVVYPPKFKALFDSLGNGVVYDHCWKKRLVYNQTEGLCYHSKHGAIMRWKWHNLPIGKPGQTGMKKKIYDDDLTCAFNDDGIIKCRRFTNQATAEVTDKRISKTTGSESYDLTMTLSQAEIEFRNKIEHRRYINTGLMRSRKVTPVKPIVMELNKHVALRISSQSNICLSFFAEGHHAKLNIGILLNPYDKFRVTRVEVEPEENEILCAFENFVPNTQSMLDLRQMLKKLKRKSRKCNRKNLATFKSL